MDADGGNQTNLTNDPSDRLNPGLVATALTRTLGASRGKWTPGKGRNRRTLWVG